MEGYSTGLLSDIPGKNGKAIENAAKHTMTYMLGQVFIDLPKYP